jgi:hypothetical protein
MLEGMISYRHDIGAWLNAAVEHALRAAAWAGRQMTPLMALEDLWI